MEKPKIRLKNLIRGLLYWMPPTKMYHEWYETGNMKGIFHINSHIAVDSKTPKVAYGHYETALRAATKMQEKRGVPYEVYKCIYCDGWHIGRSRATKKKEKSLSGS